MNEYSTNYIHLEQSRISMEMLQQNKFYAQS